VVGLGAAPGEMLAWDAAPCGLVRTRSDGLILLVNGQFCQWLGYSIEDLVQRRRLPELMTMGAKMFHHTHLLPLLQLQGSVSELKLDFVRQDGATVPMVLNVARRVHGGETVHDVATFVAHDRDVYEKELVQARKRLEATLAASSRLEAEARDHANAAEQMIGIVSHDLRNPLSTIAVGLQVLAGHHLPEGSQPTLRRLVRGVERATALVSDLLDFTQARLAHGLTVAKAPCDLREVIEHAVDDVRAAYPGRVLLHVHHGESACIADESRLNQLVGNLVSNAVTYGTPDKPVSVISTIEGEACSVAVRNQGTPIPRELQARIFEPMSRGADVPRNARSVGLGLFIVREIAKAHGGDIAVSSADEATTFVVTFPRRP
jgi:sigma-B regulation protein RsbU (phosphoserine phosphatase)